MRTYALLCVGWCVLTVATARVAPPVPPASQLEAPVPQFFVGPRPGPGARVAHRATAYCACPVCCGKRATGLTATGVRPIEGVTVAVDPKVWALGTCLTIFPGGRRLYAQDTGSAIKGRAVDIYMEDHERARAFGVRTVYVEVCK